MCAFNLESKCVCFTLSDNRKSTILHANSGLTANSAHIDAKKDDHKYCTPLSPASFCATFCFLVLFLFFFTAF